MADSVTLVIPADHAYRALAPELASKYAELVGSSESDSRSLSEALGTALGEVIADAPPEASVEYTLQGDAGGVEIAVRCGPRAVTVRLPAPARKS
jgi:hypothetical protein